MWSIGWRVASDVGLGGWVTQGGRARWELGVRAKRVHKYNERKWGGDEDYRQTQLKKPLPTIPHPSRALHPVTPCNTPIIPRTCGCESGLDTGADTVIQGGHVHREDAE